MRAGQLSNTVTLQRAEETVSASGQVTKTWTDFATIRAELVTLSIADLATSFGEASKGTVAFRIRHFHGLSVNDRLSFRGQTFEIATLLEPSRRVMELHCEVVK